MKKYLSPQVAIICSCVDEIATSDIIRTSSQETEIVGDGARKMPTPWESKLLG